MNIMPARPIPFTGALNIRDLGGYASTNGRVTQTHRFLRAEGLNRLTGEDQEKLVQYGVRAIFDLRSDYERKETPDPVFPGIVHYDFPLLDRLNSAQAGDQIPNSMAEVYVGLLQNSGETFAEMLRQMLTVDGCVLFHCTAGKDRTGLTAMLLLGAAGVPRETIVRDYEVSEVYLAPMIEKIIRENLAPAHLLDSKRVYLETALDWIEENAGSIPLYLKQIGLTEKEISGLADKLLKP